MSLEYVPLGEIADITKLAGFEFTKYIDYLDYGEIIALRALNLRNGSIDLTDVKYISKEVSENLPRSKLYKNDILLTYTGNGYGDCAIVEENDKYHLAPNIAKITPKKINPYYLFEYINSKFFKKQMRNYIGGSSQPTIPMKTLRILEIPIFDNTTQNKVAKILSDINKKIQVNKKINKNLEQLMKCIFDDWFVNFNYSKNIIFKSSELGEIPSNWNVKKLGDVLITLESGKRPKGGISDIDDGIPSIGAENILGLGRFDYSKNKLISHDFFNQMKKGIIQDQDVLLYKDGAQLGRKSLFMNGFPFEVCCINEHVFRLQSNDEISQFYLYLWLDQPIMTNEIINLNSNSAQPGINQTDVKSLPILVPDIEIVTRFENIISPMMNQIFDNALEINKLSKLRDTLLPKLMSGEIDVTKINCDISMRIIIFNINNTLMPQSNLIEV